MCFFYLAYIVSGLAQSVQLAQSLLKFPQKCMNTDRESAYYAAYRATSEDDALEHEYDNGIHVILEESIPGKQVSRLPKIYYAAHRASHHICR